MSQIQNSPTHKVSFKPAEDASNISDRLRTRKSVRPSTNKSTNSSKSSKLGETMDDDSVFSMKSVSKPSMEHSGNSSSMLKCLEMANARRKSSVDDDSVFGMKSVSKPSMEYSGNSSSMLKCLDMASARRKSSNGDHSQRRSNVANSTRRPSITDVAGIDSTFCPEKIVASIRKSSTGRRMSFDSTNDYDSMISDISEMPTMVTIGRPEDRFVAKKRSCGCIQKVTTVVTEKIIRTTPRETTTYYKKTESKQMKN